MSILLEKFYKHCGIQDPIQQIPSFAGFEEVNGKDYIVIKVYHKRIDWTEEYLFGPECSLYNFVKEHFNIFK